MNENYQQIILITDGTETSDVAEQTAINLAKEHAASVLVVDTIRPRSSISKWLTSKYDDHFDDFVAEKQDRVEQVAQRLKTAGVDVAAEVLFGKSSESIARKALTFVRKGKCLLVVRGTHKEVMGVESIINDLFDVRSHILTLHGHEFHEHPFRK